MISTGRKFIDERFIPSPAEYQIRARNAAWAEMDRRWREKWKLEDENAG